MTEQAPKEVFKTKVNERLAMHPNAWTGKDSAAVTRSLVENCKGRDGKLVKPSELELAIIQLASQPTFELQVRVIRGVLEANGGTFDGDTEKWIRKCVSPTAFKNELIKAGRIKDEGNDTLNDVLG